MNSRHDFLHCFTTFAAVFTLLAVSAAAAPIQPACDCTVSGRVATSIGEATATDGGSDYVFRGCGAHSGHSSGDGSHGYPTKMCFVADGDGCDSEELFYLDSEAWRWNLTDTAVRECSGDLVSEARENQTLPLGAVIVNQTVLEAPLGWSNCAELCRNTSGVSGCLSWAFDPASGDCMLLSSEMPSNSSSSPGGTLTMGPIGWDDFPWTCVHGRQLQGEGLCADRGGKTLFISLFMIAGAHIWVMLAFLWPRMKTTMDVAVLPAKVWNVTTETVRVQAPVGRGRRPVWREVDVVSGRVAFTQPGCGVARVSDWRSEDSSVVAAANEQDPELFVRYRGPLKWEAALVRSPHVEVVSRAGIEAMRWDDPNKPLGGGMWIAMIMGTLLLTVVVMIVAMDRSRPAPEPPVYDSVQEDRSLVPVAWLVFAVLFLLTQCTGLTVSTRGRGGSAMGLYDPELWTKYRFEKDSLAVAAAVADDRLDDAVAVARGCGPEHLVQALVTACALNKGPHVLSKLLGMGAHPHRKWKPHPYLLGSVSAQELFPDMDMAMISVVPAAELDLLGHSAPTAQPVTELEPDPVVDLDSFRFEFEASAPPVEKPWGAGSTAVGAESVEPPPVYEDSRGTQELGGLLEDRGLLPLDDGSLLAEDVAPPSYEEALGQNNPDDTHVT